MIFVILKDFKFVNSNTISSNDLRIITHLKSLRFANNDDINVYIEQTLYICKIIRLTHSEILLHTFSNFKPEINIYNINVYQSLVKYDNIRSIVKNLSILPIHSLNFFKSLYSPITSLADEFMTSLHNIRHEAMMQSGQFNYLNIKSTAYPNLENEKEYSITLLTESEMSKLLCTESINLLDISTIYQRCSKLNIVIGPEGGFDSRDKITSKYIYNLPKIVYRSDDIAFLLVNALIMVLTSK